MSDSSLTFQVPPSLKEYSVSEREYLRQRPEHHILVVGAVVFHEGKLLLIQRSASEVAFPLFWEIPGGMMEKDDKSILHATARELKEETGLEVTKFVRKVGQLEWTETSKRTGETRNWLKLIFEVEVKEMNIVLDPVEHQAYLFATEEEISTEKAKGIALSYITPPNKAIKLDAFRLRSGSKAAV